MWYTSLYKSLCHTVLILAGIFDLVLVFILRWKCLIVLVTFYSFESFIVLVDKIPYILFNF